MSKTKLKIECTIENKELKIKDKNHRKMYKIFIDEAPYGRYWFELRKKRGIRTTGKSDEMSNQNGYYWGVVIPTIRDYFRAIKINMTQEEIHNGIKSLFLNQGMHSGFPKIKSMTDLDRLEWEQLMKNIREHFLENYHLYIPEPNE